MKINLLLQPLLICVCAFGIATQGFAQSARVLAGKSYVNVNKGVNGGTIEPGDILEIRATIAVGNFDGRSISNTHYVDTIPANTTYIPGSLKTMTNEGITFRAFSDGSGDDQAYFDPAGRLRINLGSAGNAGADLGGNVTSVAPWAAPNGGLVHASGRPSYFQGMCIISASYRIRVNASVTYGSFITMPGGAFYFRNNGTNTVSPCASWRIAVQENAGLCANSIGASAVIDYGGTFGAGTTQNRATSAIIPGFVFQNVATGQPADGNYSIVNNLSPSGNTNPNSPIPNNTNRVHGRWDIMGDHTGATNPQLGNAPVAPGANGGYFVAINAAYANSNAIQQTVGGLCPNTYYEFSAWFRNICRYCGCDTTGQPSYGSSGSTFFPNPNFRGADSSGVNPNLTFMVDGVDYYTTGNLPYTGQWVKKGFIVKTGANQTSFTITIRNNAAGGGGNDWAIDDVTLATCTPNLDLRPSPSLTACTGQAVDMYADIRCYFPNYIYWRWERSNDGTNWTNTGVSGTGNPVLTNGEYEFRASYPTFLAGSSFNNVRYRIRIASRPENLDDNDCSFTATTLITITTQNCSVLVQGEIQNFSGQVVNELGRLQWTTVNEGEGTSYEVEASFDNLHFQKIGTVPGTGLPSHTYYFTDPQAIAGKKFYRLKLTDGKSSQYSRILQLSNGAVDFSVKSIVNPFLDKISMEMTSPDNKPITITLLDAYGRLIRKTNTVVNKGYNTITLYELGNIQPGAYIIQIKHHDAVINRQVLKLKRE
ncbi:T9SS type A sorting domain-containing protein [Paraflavitalea pollutisoli]|uniref:T9SS type A sorting domain-containing protein n=1 Tax=Paraflavitalea pollutisoli TaxID=3034143 RepID=UPI0023EBEB1A|nr:T9SS type A sorting domain-containing protein [Paraflavitalea sp. H1-2-19X]